MRTWLIACSVLLAATGAVPVHAQGADTADKAQPCAVSVGRQSDKRVADGRGNQNCVRVEVITTTDSATADVGAESVMRTKTACVTTEAWVRSRVVPDRLLFRVRTCEWFRYNGIDLGDFQDPPTVTVETPDGYCSQSGRALSDAHYTDDDIDPIQAWGQVNITCPAVLIPTLNTIRHEIYPHADGTWHS